jgi:putative DNA primase/helicase
MNNKLNQNTKDNPCGWDKWPTTPKKGECGHLLDLLRSMCENTIEYEWVVKWLAYPIQHPGARMKAVLVVHGGQGTGKSLFFEAVGKIYEKYAVIVDAEAIESKFTEWKRDKLFMIVEEGLTSTYLNSPDNNLADIINAKTLQIKEKNKQSSKEKNRLNLVFFSSPDKSVYIAEDDDISMVIGRKEKLAAEFYKKVAEEIENGGIAALHHYLLNVNLDGFPLHD